VLVGELGHDQMPYHHQLNEHPAKNFAAPLAHDLSPARRKFRTDAQPQLTDRKKSPELMAGSGRNGENTLATGIHATRGLVGSLVKIREGCGGFGQHGGNISPGNGKTPRSGGYSEVTISEKTGVESGQKPRAARVSVFHTGG
jgi:hypothetical protein